MCKYITADWWVPLEAFCSSATVWKPKCVVRPSWVLGCCCCCCCWICVCTEAAKERRQSLHIQPALDGLRRSRLDDRWMTEAMVWGDVRATVAPSKNRWDECFSPSAISSRRASPATLSLSFKFPSDVGRNAGKVMPQLSAAIAFASSLPQTVFLHDAILLATMASRRPLRAFERALATSTRTSVRQSPLCVSGQRRWTTSVSQRPGSDRYLYSRSHDRTDAH